MEADERFLLFLGASFTSLASFCFGLCVYLPNGTLYFVGCALTRILLGTGCGLNWSTAIPTLSACYPQWESRIPCLTEVVFSIGQLLGPAIATLLYSLDGYYLPFVMTGLLQFALMLLTFMVLPSPPSSSVKVEIENKDSQNADKIGEKDEKLRNVFDFSTSYGVNSISTTIVVSGMTLGFVGVAISPHLEDNFSITQQISGYYFLPHSLLAVVGMFTLGLVVERGFAGPLCISGSILAMTNYAFLFLPVLFPSLLSNLTVFMIAFTVLGFTIPAAILPAYLLLEKASLVSVGLEDIAKIKLYVSSWINIFLNIGFILGEFLIGGWIFDHLGFHLCCFALFIVTFLSFILSTHYMSANKFISKVFYSE